MKAVSGTVLSSKPISLSKATSVLATFVSTDNGASQATSAYLRRTLASFKELKQLHKDLRKASANNSHSGHKRKRRSSDVVDDADNAATQSKPKRKRHCR